MAAPRFSVATFVLTLAAFPVAWRVCGGWLDLLEALEERNANTTRASKTTTISTTRRRMARERRGAESCVVSMETL